MIGPYPVQDIDEYGGQNALAMLMKYNVEDVMKLMALRNRLHVA